MSALIERGRKIKCLVGFSGPGRAFGLTFLLMMELIGIIIVNGGLRYVNSVLRYGVSRGRRVLDI